MIGTSQDTDTINKQERSPQQEITILKHINPTKISNRIWITTQNSAKITIIPRRSNITQQDDTIQPIQSEQKANTDRDPNNNIQKNLRANTPTQHQEFSTPTVHATTRRTYDETIYRLTPMGKSDHPGHQAGPCYTHLQNDNSNPQRENNNSEWVLVQIRDPQGVNYFHQVSNGKLTTTGLGYPECNYCKLPSHSRQKCAFCLKDLEDDIDRHYHLRKGFPTKPDARTYRPPQKRNRSPMSIRLAKEWDNTGNPKFWQTQNGHIIYLIDNQPQCSYFGIPSHGRDTCPHRRNDEGMGVTTVISFKK